MHNEYGMISQFMLISTESMDIQFTVNGKLDIYWSKYDCLICKCKRMFKLRV